MNKYLKSTLSFLITIKLIIALLIFSAFYGCATISYRSDDCRRPPDYLYPATRTDFDIYYYIICHGGCRLANAPIMVILAVPLIIDLPFSITTDTLLLPYDLHSKAKSKNNRLFCSERDRRKEFRKDLIGNVDNNTQPDNAADR